MKTLTKAEIRGLTPSPHDTPGPLAAIMGINTTSLPKYFNDFEGLLRRKYQGRGKLLSDSLAEFAIVRKFLVRPNASFGGVNNENTVQNLGDLEAVWGWFAAEGYSLGYTKRVLLRLNQFLRFAGYPLPLIPPPRGLAKRKIADQNSARSTTSRALSEELIERGKRTLRVPHFNWLYISFYFGLRPGEVDALRDPAKWKVENINNTEVLHVWSGKVGSWKSVPVLFSEQKQALTKVRAGNFKRPHPRTLQRHLGEGVMLYAGRKGFSELLASRGVDLETASLLLGHASVETTRRYYVQQESYQQARIRRFLEQKTA